MTQHCLKCNEPMQFGPMTQEWWCVFCSGAATKREIDTSAYPADTATPDMFAERAGEFESRVGSSGGAELCVPPSWLHLLRIGCLSGCRARDGRSKTGNATSVLRRFCLGTASCLKSPSAKSARVGFRASCPTAATRLGPQLVAGEAGDTPTPPVLTLEEALAAILAELEEIRGLLDAILRGEA